MPPKKRNNIKKKKDNDDEFAVREILDHRALPDGTVNYLGKL